MPAKSNETTLLICPSGKSAWDEAARLQGAADMPLTEKGMEEIRDQVNQLPAGLKIGVVYTSPDEGSLQTAEILVEHFGGRLKTLDDLREMDLGLWEGSVEDDLCDRFTKAYRLWKEDPAAVTPAEGESLLEVQNRLLRAISRISEKAARNRPAVVLRPIIRGLFYCLLEKVDTSHLRKILQEHPLIEQVTFNAGDLGKSPEEVTTR